MPVTAITLVCNPASPALNPDMAEAALNTLGAFGRVESQTLSEGIAEDFVIAAAPPRAEINDALAGLIARRPIDIIIQPARYRRKRVLIADMDSTIIAQECIDELADFAGVRNEVAAVTERAMRGELGFEGALTERVAMLKGLSSQTLEDCFNSRITLNPGAERLVRTMNAHGALTMLVSGGFTFFVERVARRAGFQAWRANNLEIENGRLTGRIIPPVIGREAKQAALLDAIAQANVTSEESLAVGDGANDLDMIAAAGLGAAYRAKPKVAAAADARIEYGDLTALLFAQGFDRSCFSE
ncbi:MAG: phosphoserine phosphatase SerB [Parvularculaceae bacterium]|nr:phosphoserine phosphatase SerB [Parvularculaceae bacterium]